MELAANAGSWQKLWELRICILELPYIEFMW